MDFLNLRHTIRFSDPAFWLGEADDRVRKDPTDPTWWRTLSRCHRALGHPLASRMCREAVRRLVREAATRRQEAVWAATRRLNHAEDRLMAAGRAMLHGKQDQFNALCDAAVEYTDAKRSLDAARKAAGG